MISENITVSKTVWGSVLEFWEEAMEERFEQAYEWWGNRADKVIWPVLFDLLKECARVGGLTEMNPRAIVDNFLVSGEMVRKSEFHEKGKWDYYWKKYNGDWGKLCEDAIVHADDPEKPGESYALMRY